MNVFNSLGINIRAIIICLIKSAYLKMKSSLVILVGLLGSLARADQTLAADAPHTLKKEKLSLYRRSGFFLDDAQVEALQSKR